MRTRAVVVGLACVALVVVLAVAAAPNPSPQPVSVVNFPATQPVSGTVQVGNLPAVQQVAGTVQVGNLPALQAVTGTVNVGNLPLDAEGNLRIAQAVPPVRRLAGYTQATFPEGSGLLSLNRSCEAEYPGSLTCDRFDMVRMSPPPPVATSYAVLVAAEGTRGTGGVETFVGIPVSACMSAAGRLFDCGSGPFPVACCD